MGGLFHKLRHPRRCYVVCTIPRSGSNLLTDGLRETRRAGMPKQFFLPKAESRYAADVGIDPAADYAAYVRGIVNTKITPNEVFGLPVSCVATNCVRHYLQLEHSRQDFGKCRRAKAFCENRSLIRI